MNNHIRSLKSVKKDKGVYFLIPILMLIGVVFTLIPFFATSYITSFLLILFINITVAQGWNLIGGYTGKLSFGHAAFFGAGAYTAALFEVYWKTHFLLSIFMGGVVAFVLALIIGYPFLRLKGPYFAIGTLGFSEMIRVLVSNEDRWTGGASGIEIPGAFFVGMPISGYYFIILSIMAITLLGTYWFTRSELGLACICIREDETAAEVLGIHSTKYKLTSFALSALPTGLAGGFYLNFMTYIDPSTVFSTGISIKAVAIALLGGGGTLLGPIIGAIIISLLAEVFRPIFTYAYLIIYGALLIGIVFFVPGGIVGAAMGTHPLRIPRVFLRKKL